jgi:hypothetical protein
VTPRELVLSQFPGRITIGLIEAGKAIGLENQTSYNLHHQQRFPMRVIIQNRKPMVALTELIHYLETRCAMPPANDEPKRKPGRPRANRTLAA